MNVCIVSAGALEFVFCWFDQDFQTAGKTLVLGQKVILTPRWGPAA